MLEDEHTPSEGILAAADGQCHQDLDDSAAVDMSIIVAGRSKFGIAQRVGVFQPPRESSVAELEDEHTPLPAQRAAATAVAY